MKRRLVKRVKVSKVSGEVNHSLVYCALILAALSLMWQSVMDNSPKQELPTPVQRHHDPYIVV